MKNRMIELLAGLALVASIVAIAPAVASADNLDGYVCGVHHDASAVWGTDGGVLVELYADDRCTEPVAYVIFCSASPLSTTLCGSNRQGVLLSALFESLQRAAAQRQPVTVVTTYNKTYSGRSVIFE